jgi:hypothetical protein
MPISAKCPICKQPVERANPEFPFCTDRCRLLDLGNWASERYIISSPAFLEDLEATEIRGSGEGSNETEPG